jgi:transcriptional regulator of arginine metabolism
MMANKRERQRTIRQIVESREVASQEELRKLLLQRGWDVTQSTLSRDLREMRLARVPIGEGVRYKDANGGGGEDDDTGTPNLDVLLPALFQHIDGVGELAVLRTVPGGAQPVASALDAEERPDVLGTIAGDDTILIVCRSAAARERLIRQLRTVARG